MTTAQVVDTSVTVNNNSPIQDYVHPDDQTQPTFEMTPGFKPFTVDIMLTMRSAHCIYFYGFKQDQLTSTIFNSITNHFFLLLKVIYSVVFA